MSIEQEISTRLFTGSDIWSPRKSQPRRSGGYFFPPRLPSSSTAAEPRLPKTPKIVIPNLLKQGDAKQATNAARPLSEFIRGQQEKLDQRPRGRRRRPLSAPSIDNRLWPTEHSYAAWTICGQLVTIEDPQPGQGSPKVRLAEREEIRQLLAVNRLISTVIALYQGDDFSEGGVTRYMLHNDLGKALGAALGSALEFEASISLEHGEVPEQRPRSVPKKGFKPLKKSRFHPLGNFIIYQEPSSEDNLPDYAIKLFLLPVPKAFETKRQAERYIHKHVRHGNLPEACKIARVLRRALVTPIMRRGFKRPRDPEHFLEMVRRDPRVIQSELKVEWLPRCRQGADGIWRLEEQRNRSTVRHGVRHRLREDLLSEAERLVNGFKDQEIRRSLGEGFEEVEGLDRAMQLAFRSERVLPMNVKHRLGIADWTLGPEWPELHRRAGESPEGWGGHWIRAPFECGKPHTDGLRSRIVEFPIEDLAELLMRNSRGSEFWLIQEYRPVTHTSDKDPMPKIVLPISWEETVAEDGVLSGVGKR